MKTPHLVVQEENRLAKVLNAVLNYERGRHEQQQKHLAEIALLRAERLDLVN